MKHFISIQAVRAVGVLALVLTLSMLSQAQPVPIPCCTNFNDNVLHGYQSCVLGGVAVSLTTGGPGGSADIYLRAVDQPSGPASAVCAGPDCLGDWTAVATQGGTLSYWVKVFYDGCEPGTPGCQPGGYWLFHPNLSIYSGTVRAGFLVTTPAFITDDGGPNPGWHCIVAPIAPRDLTPAAPFDGLPYNSYGHWVMGAGELPTSWDPLLLAVTKIVLPAFDVTTYSEIMGYDDICLSAPCCTDFNDNLKHGYESCEPGGVDVTLATGGPGDPTDIYLHAVDRPSGPTSAVCAGPDCLGDWTAVAANGCGGLCYDVKVFYDGCEPGTPGCLPGGYWLFHPNLSIYNGTDRAVFVVANPSYITDAGGPNPGWHHIVAPIAFRDLTLGLPWGGLPYNSYGHWEMLQPPGDNTKWDPLLLSVTKMTLPAFDVTTNSEIFGYDNICVRGDVCPPVVPTLSEWAAIIFGTLLLGSVVFYIWRRRRAVAA